MAQKPSLGNAQFGRWRFLVFLAILLIAGVALERPLLAGFDIAAAYFLLSCARLFMLAHSRIREAASANDATRAVRLVLGLVTVIVIFAAITAQIVDRQALRGIDKLLIAVTLALVWTFANALYALHYAHLYYSPDSDGGLEFPGGQAPDMADFAYFAFTIGVAVQTADVAISSSRIRRVVTMHAILGFFFNIGVLALSINVLGSG